MTFNIEEELKKLPAQPGVYIMHDATDQIIYVGKAISLTNRVRQYFQSSRNKTCQDRADGVPDRLVRVYHCHGLGAGSPGAGVQPDQGAPVPRYNTMLKDDKAYPYIKVTVYGGLSPGFYLPGTMKKDKSKYFGPYTSAGAVKDTIDLIHKLYKIRTCSRNLPKDIGKDRPCLNYHIKQCDGARARDTFPKSSTRSL